MNAKEKWFQYQNLDSTLYQELKSMSEQELYEAFYQDLEFGTGGIRGIIGPGTNRINIYTLRRVNYGYARYLLQHSKNKTAVIAYDSRRMSDIFALESARMLATMGIKVYLFRDITATPVLSFAIRRLQTGGGIVITASHNPKIYNGYKVYNAKGCQLLPNEAEIVMKEIKEAPDAFGIYIESAEKLFSENMIQYLNTDIYDEYLKNVKGIQVYPELKKDNLKVVFTPLHGTAYNLGPRLLKELGYEFFPVTEQMIPDSNFSTVSYPNPETLKTFEYAIRYAKQNKADVCVATDPDADRIGVVVQDKGAYKLLTGNETGVIILNYLAEHKQTKKTKALINTIVTSELSTVIAKHHNISVHSVLTGFKFIAEKLDSLPGLDEEFLFAYEESNGFLLGDFIRDKDAFQGLTIILEAVNYYKQQGKTFIDVLKDLDNTFGFYRDELINLEFEGVAGIKQIGYLMNLFRTTQFHEIAGYPVLNKDDYLIGERTGKNTGKLTLPKSDVLKYYFSDGGWIVFRPSGTEPKMKVYLSVCGADEHEALLKISKIKSEIMKIIKKAGVNNEK